MSISGTNDSDTRSSKMEKKIYNLLRSITIYKVSSRKREVQYLSTVFAAILICLAKTSSVIQCDRFFLFKKENCFYDIFNCFRVIQ